MSDIPDDIALRIINNAIADIGAFKVLQLLNEKQTNTHRLSERYGLSPSDIALLQRAAFEYRLAVKSSVMDVLVEKMQPSAEAA